MKASRLLIAGAVASLFPIAGAFAQGTTPPDTTQPAQESQGATFESLDTNSDGRISKTEAAANANVTQQFSSYDKNGDGFIERAEVSATNTAPQEPPAKQ